MNQLNCEGIWWTGKESGNPPPFRISSLKAVLFDWAGTTIDYGSIAPVEVFRAVFNEVGVQVTESEARGPMGQAKIDHIRAMIELPRITQAWAEHFHRPPNENDVQELYQRFLPLQQIVLAEHSDVIPGIPETIQALRALGIKIGSTTGYTRTLMDCVEPIAKQRGYAPDATVCSDEVVAGRPAPWQNFRAAERLGVYPMSKVAIADDSLAGIHAGKHAGCWTIAVAQTGNALGLTLLQCQALQPSELQQRNQSIARDFLAKGADLVVRSIEDLQQLIALEQ